MNNKHYENFSFLTIGRIITLAIQSAFFLIFAYILEPKDYGVLGYLIALAGTFSVVSRFGLPQTVVVYRAKGENLKADQVNFLGVITTSVASMILLFINEFSAILCLGLSFFFLYQHNLLGEKKYKQFFKNALLSTSLTFILPFPLYFVLDISGILLGMALGNIIASVWFLKSIKIRSKPFQLIKNNYKVILNNFGVSANNNLVRYIDKVLIGIIFAFEFLGVYVFITQVLFALEILPRVLYLFLLSEESSGEKHKKISNIVIFSSVLIVLGVVVLSPAFIEQFFPKYSEGIIGLQIMVVSIIPTSISLMLSAKMQAIESTKVGYSALVRIGSLLVLIGVLGSLFELIGVSIAIVIASILNTIFLVYLYRKFIP